MMHRFIIVIRRHRERFDQLLTTYLNARKQEKDPDENPDRYHVDRDHPRKHGGNELLKHERSIRPIGRKRVYSPHD